MREAIWGSLLHNVRSLPYCCIVFPYSVQGPLGTHKVEIWIHLDWDLVKEENGKKK